MLDVALVDDRTSHWAVEIILCVLDALLVVFRVEADVITEPDLRLDAGLGVEVGFLVLVVFDLLGSTCLVEVGLIFVSNFIVDRVDDLYVVVIFLALVVGCLEEVMHGVDVGLTNDADLLVGDFDIIGIGGRDAEPIRLEL